MGLLEIRLGPDNQLWEKLGVEGRVEAVMNTAESLVKIELGILATKMKRAIDNSYVKKRAEMSCVRERAEKSALFFTGLYTWK